MVFNQDNHKKDGNIDLAIVSDDFSGDVILVSRITFTNTNCLIFKRKKYILEL